MIFCLLAEWSGLIEVQQNILFFTYVFLGSGATNPEYVVTADDVDKLIAVECIPMDDKGRQV